MKFHDFQDFRARRVARIGGNHRDRTVGIVLSCMNKYISSKSFFFEISVMYNYIAILEPQYLKITKYSQNQWKSWNFMIFEISEHGELHRSVGTTAIERLELFYLARKNITILKKYIFSCKIKQFQSFYRGGSHRSVQLSELGNPENREISWFSLIFIDFDCIWWFSNIEAPG